MTGLPSIAQLRALRIVEAHRQVWYESKMDPETMKMSRAYDRIPESTWRALRKNKLVERAGKPTLFDHSTPYVPTVLGMKLLDETNRPATREAVLTEMPMARTPLTPCFPGCPACMGEAAVREEHSAAPPAPVEWEVCSTSWSSVHGAFATPGGGWEPFGVTTAPNGTQTVFWRRVKPSGDQP